MIIDKIFIFQWNSGFRILLWQCMKTVLVIQKNLSPPTLLSQNEKRSHYHI